MAIEVVGQDESKAKQISCSNCGSILKYYPCDIKVYKGTDISGGPDGRLWIDCPTCDEEVLIRAW